MKIMNLIGLFVIAAIIFLFAQQMGVGKRVATKEVSVGGNIFRAEVADTAMARTRGLSGKKDLAKDEGMLFIFPFASIQTFWMKGMKFPIDIIWIHDKKIIGIVMGAEVPEGDGESDLYTSPAVADTVLEINAGLVAELGIRIGDAVDF